MTNLLPFGKRRLAGAASALAMCLACGFLASWARAADAPVVAKGEVAQWTDTTATLAFTVAAEDDKGLNVAVLYGLEDGGKSDEDWGKNSGTVTPDATKNKGEYTVILKDLRPDTPYFYRVKATNAAGTTWSEPGEFRTQPAATPLHTILLRALAILAMLFLPWVAGAWVAGRWRMPDYGWKIGLILFALVWGVYFVSTRPLKLGIDLSGGVVLVYELEDDVDVPKVDEGDLPDDEDEAKAKKEKEKVDMDKMVSAISLRVDPGGTRNVDIRTYGPRQIEVVIPRANPEEVRRIRDRISSSGSLAFRILANTQDHKHKVTIAQAKLSNVDTVWNTDGSEVLGWWAPVRSGEEDSIASYGDVVTRTANFRGKEVLKVLLVNDPYNVTGQFLSHCGPSVDDSGRPCVLFNFDSRGGRLFGEFTGQNAPFTEGGQELFRKLGIVLDGYLYSAPQLRSRITDNGQITGNFTKADVDELVNVLNAGSLPTALKKNPISELTSGPALGADTIRRGSYSIALSLVVVLLFMAFYYRFSGIVACGALLMNLLLLLGIMMALKVDFTLPGIAGLVLTVGMAVDANVLIFERIREELAKEAALRMAIRNGFDRALSAIVDSNLTTLITATLLWFIGTPQIKGFAVVLWLGVVLSMFTAIFCSRVVFDVGERRGWIKQLRMRRMIDQTNINFIGMRKIGMAFSITLIVIALVSVIARGKGLLDIDFTGGESVQLLFNQPQKIDEVRKTLEEARDEATGDKLFPDAAVYGAALQGEESGLRFIMDTSKAVSEDEKRSAIDVVESDLYKTFGDDLATNRMIVGTMETIGKPADPAAPEPEATPSDPPAAPGETKPAENQQTRNDLPPPTVLAAADPADLLLAQAEPTTEANDAPAVESPEKKPAEEAKADVPETAETTPGEKPGAETPPTEATPSETPSAAPEAVQPAGRFEGGTRVELHFEFELDHETVKDLFSVQMAKVDLGAVPFDLSNERYEPGDTNAYVDWVLRVKLPAEVLKEKVLDPLEHELATTPFFPSSSSIGGKVAGDMQEKAIYALLGSLICIVGYLWIRFQRVSYGLAAVVALVHDVIITLGALAISAYLAPMLDTFKISLSVLAAFLTIIGYSLNDTIVVFDRIREVKGKSPELTGDMINSSINQTLSRTLLTSLTTLIVVVILFFGGGSGLHPFAYSLMVGIIIGTYSSIFIASPILYWMSKPAATGNKKPSGGPRS
ncbi:MAG: protein translocase subunit SecD [Pirellulales bacterium]|nr:protein translocase subunit SecD [Pirellulales bacterium]